jgi:hypothetical protein
MNTIDIDLQPQKNEVRNLVMTNSGYIRRQKWTHPAVSSATAIMPAIITAASIPSANFYTFTVTSANATAAATYTNNGVTYTVLATISSGTTLYLSGSGAPSGTTLTKASGTGDATITFSAATAGFGQPDFPRIVTIVSTGSDHDAAGVVTVSGTDIRGAAISDAITLNGNTSVNGVKAFKTITNIDTSACTAIDANAGVEVGTGAALGLDRLMDADEYLQGSYDGTFEATRATIAYSATVISQNTVIFNTTLGNTHTFRAVYVTKELTNSNATTS